MVALAMAVASTGGCGAGRPGLDLAARGSGGSVGSAPAPIPAPWRLLLDPSSGFEVHGAWGDLGGMSPPYGDGVSRQYFAEDPDGVRGPFVSIATSGMSGATYEDPKAPVQIDGHAVLVHELGPGGRSLVYRLGDHAIEVRARGVTTADLVAGLSGGHVADGRLVVPNWPSRLRPVHIADEHPPAQSVLYLPVGLPADGRDRIVIHVYAEAAYASTLLADNVGGTADPGAAVAAARATPQDEIDRLVGHETIPFIWPWPDGSIDVHIVWRDDDRGRAVAVIGHVADRQRLDAVLSGLRDLDETAWQALPHTCTSSVGVGRGGVSC